MKAVDIVLLPDDAMHEKLIELSQSLTDDERMHLDESTLPHISLLMGGLPEGKQELLAERLEDVSKTHEELTLTADRLHNKEIRTGETLTEIIISRTVPLMDLRAAVVSATEDILRDDVEEEHLYGDDPVNHPTLEWVRTYRKYTDGPNFRPHITVGMGAGDEELGAREFTAPELAVCHIGSYSTCKKVLRSFTLN